MAVKNENTDMKKIIISSLGRHGLRTALTLLLIVSSIILQVLPPLLLGKAVDSLTDNAAVSAGLAVGYFLLLVCSGLSDAVREGLIVATGEGITHALRSAMMAKLHRLPASYFNEHEAGTTAAIQVNDVDAIEDMFSSGIVSMFSDLGTVVSILIVVFDRSRGLGVLLLVVLPVLFIFTRHVQKKMLQAHTQNRKATAEAGGVLPETMHMIRTLHVYHAEGFAKKRYDRAIQNSFQAIERTNFYDAVYSPVIMTVSAAVIGVMMSLSGQSGAFRSWFGMSVGTAVALIAYVNSIFTPLSSIGMEIQAVQAAAAGWKRVQNFLREPERPEAAGLAESADVANGSRQEKNGAGVVSMEAGQERCSAGTTAGMDIGNGNGALEGTRMRDQSRPMLDVQRVNFSYDGTHPVLQDFSLQVGEGEFVTLTGRTGIGKSTLFRLLLGLYEPQSGEIRVGGRLPREFTEEERRRTICCVEQKVSTVPGTIMDQVTLGNAAYSEAEVWTALRIAGLADTVQAVPGQLRAAYTDSVFSQGQKELLMIARAVVSDPSILLLDEITAGLDSATEKMIVEALQKASAGRTVLSISHRLSQTMPGRVVTM